MFFLRTKNNPWTTVYDALDATGEIEYSDEFFLEPSPGDHPELSAAKGFCCWWRISQVLTIHKEDIQDGLNGIS